MLLYQQGFRYYNMGYASAMAMLLLVVALAVTLVILRSSRLWVLYQGATADDYRLGRGPSTRAAQAAATSAAGGS